MAQHVVGGQDGTTISGGALPVAPGRSHIIALALGAGLPLALLAGCGTSSYMDPSVTGRWQPTPTTMPILDRLASIEESSTDLVEQGPPLPEDLIPRPDFYRIGPGDVLEITIFDLIAPGEREEYRAINVDARGMIELPQLGRIMVQDKTTEEAVAEIEQVMRDRNLVQNPLVQVIARSQRGATFTIVGSVNSPGLYNIPKADFRILEAISSAGAFDPSIREIFVIRQVPLSEAVVGGVGQRRPAPRDDAQAPQTPPTTTPPAQGQNLIDLIDSIAPQQPATAPPTPPASEEPSTPPANPGAVAGQAVMQRAIRAAVTRTQDQGSGAAQPASSEPPVIDLIEPGQAANSPVAEDGSTWVFVGGKWMRVRQASPAEADATSLRADELVTQRIIRIPVADLLAGKQSINIVIRPGDVIRFPASATGFIYVSGEVARPGVYQMAPGLTLLRAMSSAGGLSEIGIPWRVDLTRKVGDGSRQATIRLDLGAIAAQTQPDLLLKSDDLINVGTLDWALPLAVVRNGFRVSYGFGFLADRNFGNDLFGAPPTNQLGQ